MDSNQVSVVANETTEPITTSTTTAIVETPTTRSTRSQSKKKKELKVKNHKKRKSLVYHPAEKHSENGVLPTRKHRFHAGTRALREIRWYQKNSDLTVIPKITISNIVKTMIHQNSDGKVRCKKSTYPIIQNAVESFLVERFQAANLLCVYRNRQTPNQKDMQVAAHLLQKGSFCA